MNLSQSLMTVVVWCDREWRFTSGHWRCCWYNGTGCTHSTWWYDVRMLLLLWGLLLLSCWFESSVDSFVADSPSGIGFVRVRLLVLFLAVWDEALSFPSFFVLIFLCLVVREIRRDRKTERARARERDGQKERKSESERERKRLGFTVAFTGVTKELILVNSRPVSHHEYPRHFQQPLLSFVDLPLTTTWKSHSLQTPRQTCRKSVVVVVLRINKISVQSVC